jgi:hypothetical protein
MNYVECYNRLVESRQILGRSKGTGVYYEKHHVVPRWLNGKDTKDNLVLFTAKEHYIAHLLLWKHYRDRPSALAFHKMTKSTNKNQQRKFTSMQFEKARLAFVQTQLGDLNWARNNESPLKGKPNVNKGKKLGKRDWMTGDNNPSRQDSVKESIRSALKGRKRTEEHNRNLQAALTPEIKKLRSQKIWESRRRNQHLKLLGA